MSPKESNNGFLELHTPMGMLILAFAFMMIIAFIGAGAAFFKAAALKDREAREKLRAENAEH